MRFTKHFATRKTNQRAQIPGKLQVRNSAGGFVWKTNEWQKLDRFLILGTEKGTFYIGEKKLTTEHASNLLGLVKSEGEKTVRKIVDVSLSGRAPKNDPAIFALAVAASFGNESTRRSALSALPQVCRTGTHLFQFAAEIDEMRGWGRGLRRAVGDWYNAKDADALGYQALKYRQRNGWSHRDLLRLAHPKASSEAHGALYKWIVDGSVQGVNKQVEAFELLKTVEDPSVAAKLIAEHRLTRELVPTSLLKSAEVWEALLDSMPLTAMVRNLGNMTKCGLLQPGSDATAKVVARLVNIDSLKAARVHPLSLLLAHVTYASGQGMRGSGSWASVGQIVDALGDAFYVSFGLIKPTDKRYLLGVDVSSSMEWHSIAGSPLTAAQAAVAMALVTVATERAVYPMAFSHKMVMLNVSPRMRLADACEKASRINFGGTDVSLPMQYAEKNRLEIDVFVVYTDNETWYGNIHPIQALERYRQKTGIPAKLAVVAMAGNDFTVADPEDPGTLDVVGFDASVPQALREFALA